jgi:hypothetical protein
MSWAVVESIQPLIQWVEGGGGERPEHETHHLHPTPADDKKMWMYAAATRTMHLYLELYIYTSFTPGSV